MKVKTKTNVIDHKNKIDELVVQFWLPGKGIGKARGRYSSVTKTVYLPENYALWKQTAFCYIRTQMMLYDIWEAPKPVSITCDFVNFRSSDSDNLTGSVLDVLVDAQFLGNDSSSNVVESSGRFVKVRKKRGEDKKVGILVKVYAKKDIEIIELPKWVALMEKELLK